MLGDLAKLPIAYQGTGIITRRSAMANSASQIESVVKALLDGVAFIRNPENKAQVTRSLAKGLRLKRIEDADEGYQSMIDLYEKKFIPTSTACATSSACSALATKKSAASKPRIWWTIAW